MKEIQRSANVELHVSTNSCTIYAAYSVVLDNKKVFYRGVSACDRILSCILHHQPGALIAVTNEEPAAEHLSALQVATLICFSTKRFSYKCPLFVEMTGSSGTVPETANTTLTVRKLSRMRSGIWRNHGRMHQPVTTQPYLRKTYRRSQKIDCLICSTEATVLGRGRAQM